MSDLDDVGRTALLPFWARVQDSQSPNPILGDMAAAALAQRVAGRFGAVEVPLPAQVGCCLRNWLVDRWIDEIGRGHGPVTVIHIGPGLDTRLSRSPAITQRYVEVDSEAVIALRNEWLPGTGAVRVGADGMTVTDWIDEVDQGSTAVVVLEGVLAYQTPMRIRSFFEELAGRLPSSFVLFDSVSPYLARRANQPTPLTQGRPRYTWAIRTTRRLTAGPQRVKVLQEKGFMDFPRQLTRSFSRRDRLVHSMPPLRRAYRLTMAQLPGPTVCEAQ